MELSLFKTYLEKHGLRFTPERRMILEEVYAYTGHFDPDEICDRLRARGNKASKASVYRTFPLLLDAGLIAEVLRSGNRIRYERTVGRSHHDHMICDECGAIIEFTSPEIEQLQDAICARHNFKSRSHMLEIRGTCTQCRGRSDTSPETD